MSPCWAPVIALTGASASAVLWGSVWERGTQYHSHLNLTWGCIGGVYTQEQALERNKISNIQCSHSVNTMLFSNCGADSILLWIQLACWETSTYAVVLIHRECARERIMGNSVCVCERTCVCVHMCVFVFVSVHVRVCVFLCEYMCVCMSPCMCV